MSNSFLAAFAVTAAIAAGAVDFVHQTRINEGIDARAYFAALPGRLGGRPAATASEDGKTTIDAAAREQSAAVESQVAAAVAATRAAQNSEVQAVAGAASYVGAFLKSMGKADSGSLAAADTPITPAKAETDEAEKPRANLIGACGGTGFGKRCKVGG